MDLPVKNELYHFFLEMTKLILMGRSISTRMVINGDRSVPCIYGDALQC